MLREGSGVGCSISERLLLLRSNKRAAIRMQRDFTDCSFPSVFLAQDHTVCYTNFTCLKFHEWHATSRLRIIIAVSAATYLEDFKQAHQIPQDLTILLIPFQIILFNKTFNRDLDHADLGREASSELSRDFSD